MEAILGQTKAKTALHSILVFTGIALVVGSVGGCSELRLQHHLQLVAAEVYWATYCLPIDPPEPFLLKDVFPLSNGMNSVKLSYTLTTMVGSQGQFTTPYGFDLTPTFQRTHQTHVEMDLRNLTNPMTTATNKPDASPTTPYPSTTVTTTSSTAPPTKLEKKQCDELKDFHKMIWKQRQKGWWEELPLIGKRDEEKKGEQKKDDVKR